MYRLWSSQRITQCKLTRLTNALIKMVSGGWVKSISSILLIVETKFVTYASATTGTAKSGSEWLQLTALRPQSVDLSPANNAQ